MRELATVGVLASLEGTNSQLLFHMGAAMTRGISEEKMGHAVEIIAMKLGPERGENAEEVLNQGMERRKNMADAPVRP